MSSLFRVVQHRVPATHLREYTRATSHSDEDILHLAVKQYIPHDNPHPQPGDVTILAAHATGFPKELYEPLWDELHARAKRDGWRIRGIWIADVAWQGESGIVNEAVLGNDPCWTDHARDLLNLVNLKREEMPRPILGVGHSMGGMQIAKLGIFHPSLFTSVILLDPVIKPRTVPEQAQTTDLNMAQLSTFRRPTWPSREAAKKSFLKAPFYKAWDPRCFDKWIERGLRDCPNHVFPELPAPHVSLATPVSQEVWTYLRPNYEGYGRSSRPVDRRTHPDIEQGQQYWNTLYRAEPYQTFQDLPRLRPSCLWVLGGNSPVNTAAENEERVRITGTGPGGSGGIKEGRVKALTLDGIGHLVAMEAPSKTAEAMSEWIAAEMELYRQRAELWRSEWWSKPLRVKQEIDQKWKDSMGRSSRL